MTGYTLWVNGIKVTPTNGTWTASSVPVGPGGTAVVEARLIPNTDNNGNGTGMTGPTDGTPGNPTSSDSLSAQLQIDQPYSVYIQDYHYNLTFSDSSSESNCAGMYSTDIGQVDYHYPNGGMANRYQNDSGADCPPNSPGWNNWQNYAYTWADDGNPATETYTDNTGSFDQMSAQVGDALQEAQACYAYPDWAMIEGQWSLNYHFAGGSYYYLTSCSVNETRSIDYQLVLDTGGKGIIGLKDLYEFDLSAKRWQAEPIFGDWQPILQSTTLSNNTLSVLGTQANTYGQVFKELAANTQANITLQAPGNNHTDNVSVNPNPPTLNSLTVVSNSASWVNSNNWAAVKTTNNDYVYVQAFLSTTDLVTIASLPTDWLKGGEAVPGNPLQRRISKSAPTNAQVTASLGPTNLSVNVWVIWGKVQILMSGSNPAPVKFGILDDGTEILGVRYYNNSNGVAGKICGVATLMPSNVHSVIQNGWSFTQMYCQTFYTNVVLSTNIPPWANDGPYTWWESVFPDATDRIYTIDAPWLDGDSAASGVTSMAVYDNFYDYITWSNQICSATNNFWHFEAAWATNHTPSFTNVDLNTNLITLP